MSTDENTLPGRSRRPLRSDAKASRRVRKNGAQDVDMNERMETAFLIVRTLNGDGSAFGPLYERNSEAVRNRIAAGLFPALRDRHLEDLTQDAWLLIWQHVGQYNPSKGRFTTFAKYWAGIALLRWLAQRRRVDLFFDALMEQRRRYPGMESDELDQLENLVHVHPFEGWWDRETLAEKVDKAIGQLLRTKSAPLEILSVLLTMFQEWPLRKIAAKLSRKTLWAVTNLVAGLVRRETHLPRQQIHVHFGALRKILGKKVEVVIKGRRYIRLLRRRRGSRVGDLLVRNFYTRTVKGGRTAEIGKWRSSAVTRLRKLNSIRRAVKRIRATKKE